MLGILLRYILNARWILKNLLSRRHLSFQHVVDENDEVFDTGLEVLNAPLTTANLLKRTLNF